MFWSVGGTEAEKVLVFSSLLEKKPPPPHPADETTLLPPNVCTNTIKHPCPPRYTSRRRCRLRPTLFTLQKRINTAACREDFLFLVSINSVMHLRADGIQTVTCYKLHEC